MMKFVVFDIIGDALLEFRNSVDVFKMFGDLSESFDYNIKTYCDGSAYFAECKGTRQDLNFLRSHTCWYITDIVEEKPMEIYVVCNSNGDYEAFTDERAAIDAAASKNNKVPDQRDDLYHVKKMHVNENTKDDVINNCQPNYCIVIEVNHDKEEIRIVDTAPTYEKPSPIESVEFSAEHDTYTGIVPSLDNDWLRYCVEQSYLTLRGRPVKLRYYKWMSDVTCEGVC